MGYEYHITRADDWSQNDRLMIAPDEWLAVVREDPELTIDHANGPYFTEWRDAWFDLVDGNVTTKNPDEPTLEKMLALAKLLNGQVQGDDGDVYDGPRPASTETIRDGILWWARYLGVYLAASIVLALLGCLIALLAS